MLEEAIEPPAALTSVSSCIDISLVLNRPEEGGGGGGVGGGGFNRLIDWLETPGQSSGSPEVAAVHVPR